MNTSIHHSTKNKPERYHRRRSSPVPTELNKRSAVKFVVGTRIPNRLLIRDRAELRPEVKSMVLSSHRVPPSGRDLPSFPSRKTRMLDPTKSDRHSFRIGVSTSVPRWKLTPFGTGLSYTLNRGKKQIPSTNTQVSAHAKLLCNIRSRTRRIKPPILRRSHATGSDQESTNSPRNTVTARPPR